MENLKVEFVVARASMTELTFARVTAGIADEKLRREFAFLEALKSALTAWAVETEKGRKAWDDSSRDFNVGDLAGEVGDETMKPYLEKVGIRWINICIESEDDRCISWLYDTVLMDRKSVESRKIPGKEKKA